MAPGEQRACSTPRPDVHARRQCTHLKSCLNASFVPLKLFWFRRPLASGRAVGVKTQSGVLCKPWFVHTRDAAAQGLSFRWESWAAKS